MTKQRPIEHIDFENTKAFTRLLPFLNERQIRQRLYQYPRHLYKYISCKSKLDHIKCLLIDSDFFLNSCSKFNDPFDTTAEIVNNGGIKQLRKRFIEIVKNRLSSSDRKTIEIEASKMMANHMANPGQIDQIFTKNVQETGIFSLTENPKNILMWSHYASDHKGLVLQFDISKDPESLLYALKMHYSREYPKYDFSSDLKAQFENIILRKAEDWAYEKEWRILRIGGANTYQPFKPETITGLIFGCRVNPEFKKAIMEILEERTRLGLPKINIYSSVMHKSKYALNVYKAK